MTKKVMKCSFPIILAHTEGAAMKEKEDNFPRTPCKKIFDNSPPYRSMTMMASLVIDIDWGTIVDISPLMANAFSGLGGPGT